MYNNKVTNVTSPGRTAALLKPERGMAREGLLTPQRKRRKGERETEREGETETEV